MGGRYNVAMGMTENQWRQARRPRDVYRPGLHRVNARKTRLLVCGYCRHIGSHIINPHRDAAIDVAERFADGEVGEQELSPMADSVRRAGTAGELSHGWAQVKDDCTGELYVGEFLVNDERFLRLAVDGEIDMASVLSAFEEVTEWGTTADFQRLNELRFQDAERCVQSALVREIFGNPFRSVEFLPSWRADASVALARQMYESRDFSRMPVLAEALEDAGCDDEQLLGHCRDHEPHVRGCWAVDLVLEDE
jgi:hypothetical protein